MSYQRMDHAGWVESNNRAGNRLNAKRRAYRPAPEKLNEVQAKAMDILGMVCGGIYNAPISWEKVDWNYGWGGVAVVVRDDGFATFDFYRLTALVFLCHEARIRCGVEGQSKGYLRLTFWQRGSVGGMAARHPNLDEAVEAFRAYLPAGHRIIYRTALPAIVGDQ